MTALKVLKAISLLLITSTAHAQVLIHVDDDAPSGGDGVAWSTAFKDLQAGLADAADEFEPVQVLVAQGTYVPGSSRTDTFELLEGVEIYGGYAGINANNPDLRRVNRFETILSGDINGDDDANFSNRSDNCYHVVTASVVTATAKLNGFTVRGGNALGDTSQPNGGGMLIDFGGVPMLPTDPVVILCTFTDNEARNGAGVEVSGAQTNPPMPTFISCSFVGNRARSQTIGNQIVDGEGGGMRSLTSRVAWINLVFRNNAAHRGGGLFLESGSAQPFHNCTFYGNAVADFGGGLYLEQNIDPTTLWSCIFYGNVSSGVLNPQKIDENVFVNGGSPLTINYSNVEGTWTGEGTGNIDADPRFWSAAFGNLTFRSDSPCIDTELPIEDAIPMDSEDIDADLDMMEATPDRDLFVRVVAAHEPVALAAR